MRININYVLDAETEKECLKINREFCDTFADSEIDFSKGCRPHMTLLMGEIEEKDYNYVIETVKKMQFNSVGREFEVTEPYAKGEYIFIDALKLDTFVHDCDLLLKELKSVLVPHRFLISNGTANPHISLCYCENAEIGEFAKQLKTFKKVRLVGVTVSKTGKHGTCLTECQEEINLCEKK